MSIRESEYYTSGQHKDNAIAAGKLAILSNKNKKLQRIEDYNNNPKLCKECNQPIPYDKKNNMFCSSSCSGTYNNTRRQRTPWNDEQREKASIAGKQRDNSWLMKLYCDIHLIECRVCGKQRYVGYKQRSYKTCGSADCMVQASTGERAYQNGSRKPIWFYNPNEDKEVLLDSSWEVKIAELLIRLDIKWIRPKFIKWVDSNDVTRRYFPDFYLPDHDLYLDPKNPYCMSRDVEKIQRISEQVKLIVGDVNMIENYVNSLI